MIMFRFSKRKHWQVLSLSVEWPRFFLKKKKKNQGVKQKSIALCDIKRSHQFNAANAFTFLNYGRTFAYVSNLFNRKIWKCFPDSIKMLQVCAHKQINLVELRWVVIQCMDLDDFAIWMAVIELQNYYLNATSSKSMNWMTNHLNPT